MLNNIMSRCDYLDFVELLHYERDACRIRVADDKTIPHLLEYLEEWDVHFGIGEKTFSTTDEYGAANGNIKTLAESEIYVAHDMFVVQETMEANRHRAQPDHIGKLFGYPQCCINAMCDTLKQNASLHPDFPLLTSAISKAQGKHMHKIMTPNMDKCILSFFPCAFDCTRATAKALWRTEHTKTKYGWNWWWPEPTVFAGVHFDVA